jgi:hypothetical protein
MTDTMHPLAPHHLPKYIASSADSDPLFTAVVVLLIVILLAVGNAYLKLHAMPERMAHKQNNTQLQVITILAVLALFTHNNIFWVGALLLSVVRLPDFSTPINSIADSLKILAEEKRGGDSDQVPTTGDDMPTTAEPTLDSSPEGQLSHD